MTQRCNEKPARIAHYALVSLVKSLRCGIKSRAGAQMVPPSRTTFSVADRDFYSNIRLREHATKGADFFRALH